ncbi:heme exporter protein CcmB [Desertibaculum subflavum]|uniref:heme exporter protein CcmB n=1 Tax=Desertibaculum subflavum TaxID=2268458 RepID=UPI000E672D47
MRAFLAILRRDIALGFRQGGTAGLALGFFGLVVLLFPLGIGPERETLGRIAAGVLWIAALLAVLISLDRLFQADHEDGSLELLALSPLPLELVVLAKLAAHWAACCLPLIALAPVLGLMLNLPPTAIPGLITALLLGTPTLSAIGAIGAALAVGVRRGGFLLSLLVLPLYVPVLIFGAGATEAAISGLGLAAHLLILAALAVASVGLSPIAAAAALRLSLE